VTEEWSNLANLQNHHSRYFISLTNRKYPVIDIQVVLSDLCVSSNVQALAEFEGNTQAVTRTSRTAYYVLFFITADACGQN
jgi:hypothetical protein